ncbi:MAG: cytochrome c biogenesis protein CcdA [Dehalococcoidia bacterium]
MEVTLFTPLLAFTAGLLSCASPCVLPLVPAYVANLSGVAAATADASRRRSAVMLHASAFVLGFTLIFVVLGASVGFVGYAIRDQEDLLRKVGGIFMIVMGLQVAEIIRIPWLSRTFAPLDERSPIGSVGYARSAGVGSAMAVGWTPCLGPTLGGILTLAATSDTALQATGLLLAYSAGLAVPFLVAGLALDRATGLARRMRPVMPFISVASGVVLIFAGALLYTDALARFNRYFTFSGPGADL